MKQKKKNYLFLVYFIQVTNYGSKEILLDHNHKNMEGSKLFSDGRLLSAHRGVYRGPSAALADSLGYLP